MTRALRVVDRDRVSTAAGGMIVVGLAAVPAAALLALAIDVFRWLT